MDKTSVRRKDNLRETCPAENENKSNETDTCTALVKIPGSIIFSDVLRGKAFSAGVTELERNLGYIYNHHHSQNKDALYEFLHSKFEYWKENYPHDIAFLWLMQGYYNIYNFTHDPKVKFYIKRSKEHISDCNISDGDHIMSRIAKMLCLVYMHTNRPGKAWKWMQIARECLQHRESCEISGFIYQCEAWVYLFLSHLYPKSRALYREKAMQSYRLCREHIILYSHSSESLQLVCSWILLDLAMLKLDIPLMFEQSLYPGLLDKQLHKCNIGFIAVTEAEMLIETSRKEFQNHGLKMPAIPYAILLRQIYLEIRRIQVTNPGTKDRPHITELSRVERLIERGRKCLEDISVTSILKLQSCKYISYVLPYLVDMYERRKQEPSMKAEVVMVDYLGDVDCKDSETPVDESPDEDTVGSEVE